MAKQTGTRTSTGNEWLVDHGNEWFVPGNEWLVGRGNEWFVPGNEWLIRGNEW